MKSKKFEIGELLALLGPEKSKVAPLIASVLEKKRAKIKNTGRSISIDEVKEILLNENSDLGKEYRELIKTYKEIDGLMRRKDEKEIVPWLIERNLISEFGQEHKEEIGDLMDRIRYGIKRS